MDLLKTLSIANMVKTATKSAWFIRKHRATIETGAGIVMVGASAVLAYKGAKKVEAIVSSDEEKLAAGQEINQKQTAVRIGFALAPSIVTFMCGAGLIFDSYRVLTNRVNMLATAVHVAHKENDRIKAYLRDKHPEVDQRPLAQISKTVTDENGNEKEVKSIERVRGDILRGFWLDESEDYERDNLTGMQALSVQMERSLQNKLMRKGVITVLDIYKAFNVPLSDQEKRELYGFGFTDSMYMDLYFQFDINGPESSILDIDVIKSADEQGVVPIPYIAWPEPRYILSSIDNAEDEIVDYIY